MLPLLLSVLVRSQANRPANQVTKPGTASNTIIQGQNTVFALNYTVRRIWSYFMDNAVRFKYNGIGKIMDRAGWFEYSDTFYLMGLC